VVPIAIPGRANDSVTTAEQAIVPVAAVMLRCPVVPLIAAEHAGNSGLAINHDADKRPRLPQPRPLRLDSRYAPPPGPYGPSPTKQGGGDEEKGDGGRFFAE
jgi:hypothetical protein